MASPKYRKYGTAVVEVITKQNEQEYSVKGRNEQQVMDRALNKAFEQEGVDEGEARFVRWLSEPAA